MAEASASTTTLSWEDTAWQRTYPLNRETVVDYFQNSIFFEFGHEYKLHRAQEVPPTPTSPAHSLYIIRKYRRDGEKLTPLKAYYVLDGCVFEAPMLHAVIRTRLLRLGWLVNSAFGSACDDADASSGLRGSGER